MSLLNIAEGAVSELETITSRQKQLAEQAANGVNGDGTFKAGASFTISGSGNSLQVGDINGDGHLDFAALGGTQLNVLLGNGDGTFKARRTYLAGGTQSPLLADFNGDGFLDHVTGGTSVTMIFGNGDGSFRAPATYYPGTNPQNVRSADLNGDGFLDLVTANASNSTASVLLNNGNGTFKAPITYQNAFRVQLGDFNEDGVTDIVTTTQSANTIGLYLGNSQPTSYARALNLSSQEGAREVLSILEDTHEKIVATKGNIGAFQQRLGAITRNLTTMLENFQSAESRIMDADVALEMSNNLKNKILQDVAAATLAQANRTPQLALQLLS